MNRPKVLVMEEKQNQPKVLDILSKRANDWEIQFADSVEDVIRRLHSEDISVLICGQKFHGMDCMEFSSKINKEFEDVNVVIVNMNGDKIPREHFLKSTAFDLVQCEAPNCPEEEDVLESVETAVAAKKMRDTGAIKRLF